MSDFAAALRKHYPDWQHVKLTKLGYAVQREAGIIELMKAYRAAQQEPIGDAIEIDVPLETMQFVLSKIKLKPKTIAKRLIMQEWQVQRWLDGSADKYDLNVYMWRLKLLASLTGRYNWAVFLLKPDNLPGNRGKKK
jgi:hypothetical protein